MGKDWERVRKKLAAANKSNKADKPKRKASAPRQATSTTASGERVDDMMGKLMAAAATRLGQTPDELCVSSSDAESAIVGLPLPALSTRMLFGMTVLPFERVIQVIGEEGSCKSTFLAELARWFITYGGLAAIVETENKDIPAMRNAIGQQDAQYIRRVRVLPANSQGEWMERVMFLAREWTTQCGGRLAAQKPSKQTSRFPGLEEEDAAAVKPRRAAWTVPLLLGVDSLTAVNADETNAGIITTGRPRRQFAVEANYLKSFMGVMPSITRGKPIVIVATNHMKPRLDDYGNQVLHTPGGKSMKFMESLEVVMYRGSDIREAKRGGVELRIGVRKSSTGARPANMPVRLYWETRVCEDAKPRLFAMFDWYAASIELLLMQHGNKTRWNAIQDALGLTPQSGKRIKSRELGLTNATYTEAGQALETRPDVLAAIYPVLGISVRPGVSPGSDYAELVRQAKQRADIVTQMCYQSLSLAGGAELAAALDKATVTASSVDDDEVD